MAEDKKGIPQLEFKQSRTKELDFEINSFEELVLRRSLGEYRLFRPYRLGFYAILYFEEGPGRHYVDFKQYEYQAGTLFFLAKNQVHAFDRQENLPVRVITFTEQFLERTQLHTSSRMTFQLFHDPFASPKLDLGLEQMAVVRQILRAIWTEFHGPVDNRTETILQSYLRILLLQAGRIKQDQRLQNTASTLYAQEFQGLQRLIEEYILQKHQVAFYAEALKMSTKTLNRITQSVVQQSAKAYLTEQLTLEIKRLLVHTDRSIKEIAYEAGFELPTNFVKFFKKQTDTTPAGFRKQYLG